MDSQTYHRMLSFTRELMEKHKFELIMTQQPPRPPGFRASPPPLGGIVIIDYLSILPSNHVERKAL